MIAELPLPFVDKITVEGVVPGQNDGLPVLHGVNLLQVELVWGCALDVEQLRLPSNRLTFGFLGSFALRKTKEINFQQYILSMFLELEASCVCRPACLITCDSRNHALDSGQSPFLIIVVIIFFVSVVI